MPNWCENIIEISGPRQTICTLWTRAHDRSAHRFLDGELLFEFRFLNALVPLSPVTSAAAERAWGVEREVRTFDVSYSNLTESTAQIHGSFLSAWGPPVTAVKTYRSLNTDVEISLKFWEPWNCACGEYTDQIYLWYDYSSDIEAAPSHLIDIFKIKEFYQDD